MKIKAIDLSMVKEPELWGKNLLLNSDERVYFEEQDAIPTTVGGYLPTEGGRNLVRNSHFKKQLQNWSIHNPGNGSYEVLNDIVSFNLDGRNYGLFQSLQGVTDRVYNITIRHRYLGNKPTIARVQWGVQTTPFDFGNEGEWVEEVRSLTAQGTIQQFFLYSGTQGGLFDCIWEIDWIKVSGLVEPNVIQEHSPAPEDFNNLKGKSYALSQPLRKENILSLNGSFEEDDFIGLWLGNDKFVGFLDNQELAFNLTENYDDEFVIVKTLSEKGVIDNAKLEKGNVAHKWTPAPENKSIPKIRFFEYVKIISKPHEIDDSMLIKKQTIHLDDPSQNTIEVGVEVSSFTDKQLEANNTIKKINADYVTNEKMANVVNPLNIQISTILQESDSIKLSVERLNSKTDNLLFDSILTNANGELGSYQDWKDFASNDGIIFFDELKFLENMTFATLFEILKDDSVLGGEKLSFFGNGKQEYGLRPIVGGYEYSYRAKRVKGTQPRTVEINEYDSNQVYLRKRSFIFDGTDTYEDIPNLSFGSDVKFISITYIISGVSVSNRLEIAEAMFAIGDPKPYVKSVDSVTTWARSEIKQLADEISLKVNADGVISAINVSPELVKILSKNIALEGYTSINDHFKVLPNGDVQMVNADVSGKITATSGDIGNFTIENGVLEYTTPQFDRPYTQADVAEIRRILVEEITPSPYQLYIYDVNESNTITIGDLRIVHQYVTGIGPKPIRPIKTRIRIGTLDGRVETTALYGTNFSQTGSSTVLQAEKLDAMLMNSDAISTNSLSFNGQEVYVDGGILKVRDF